jgi:adenine-specific DNA methylase
MPAFIETQFPIARLSAEAYKERKGASSQTLPKLGKWWGRKPLILVRAAILGMLLPASDNPKKDREIFLKILTMDDDGAWQRCKGEIPVAAWREAATDDIRDEYFGARGFRQGLSDEEKEVVCARIWESLDDDQRKALDDQRRRPVPDRAEFDALSYAERIRHCERPENVRGPVESAWIEINEHLGTTATNLSELVQQLGQRTFGHTPRVGDCFCGGGSIPFEAARIGCQAFGSDLNPVASLLTWASLNLLGGGREVQEKVRRRQEEFFVAADRQITEWGIEHNDRGERAEAFLYCVEVKPEGCDYYIPLAPSWVISEKYRIVVTWRKDPDSDRLNPKVITVSEEELKLFKDKKGATVIDSRVIDPFNPNRSWSIEALRGPGGLRRWTNDDLVPRPEDVFQERLYCIRWIKTVIKNGKPKEIRRYAAPEAGDLAREEKVLELLSERFVDWQQKGFIPSKAIISGYNTDQPIRERGWTHWHHLFTPRQLLVHGLFSLVAGVNETKDVYKIVANSISLAACSNWNSKLCQWLPHLAASGGIGAFAQTFYNQALNTLFNWGVRSTTTLEKLSGFSYLNSLALPQLKHLVASIDARDITETCDLWVTDPPYADAVNYHELGDFFLAWYDKQLARAFPEWPSDARAELAVRGDGEYFRRSMVEIYKNLARHMPDSGLQMVMFTHQDPAVWADLGMILWAAGLKAIAAWTISTETEAAGIKKGNYVQGTVCLVLRKRLANEPGFLDEAHALVEDEVKRQIASMQALDEGGEPNFNDADYQLAAYAAALKVLTQYGTLDGRDVEHEVFAVRARNEKSDFQALIERALSIACDTLVPRGLEASWRSLSLVERYYLRALDIESRGERRKGMYEELARGFGVTDIRPLLKSDKANGARMHIASGFGATGLSAPKDGNTAVLSARRGRTATGAAHPFASSPLRHLLFAIRETSASVNNPETGRQYLRDTFGQGYWGQREHFIALLEWLANLGNTEGMHEWINDSEAARILAGRLRNDHP